MKKTIYAVIASLGLLGGTLVAPMPAEAQAYLPAGSYTCEAVSSHAVGVWTAYDLNYACSQAIHQCRIRTPYYDRCFVNRWWAN